MLSKFIEIVLPFIKELLFDKRKELEIFEEDRKKRNKKIAIFLIILCSLSLNVFLMQRIILISTIHKRYKNQVQLELKSCEETRKQNYDIMMQQITCNQK